MNLGISFAPARSPTPCVWSALRSSRSCLVDLCCSCARTRGAWCAPSPGAVVLALANPSLSARIASR